MSELSRTFTIRYPKGLHARPSALLVDRATGFDAELMVQYRAKRVNLKSLLGVMTLAAACGAEILVEAVGRDAEAALDAIGELLETELDL